MSHPLIPYIDGASHEIPLSFLNYIPIISGLISDPRHPPSIKPFGTLVAIGVYLGSIVALKRARDRKLDEKVYNDFIFWVVATGFVLSHMLDAIFYHPDRIAADPIYLIRIWDGLSSYGGFIGAIIGMFAWKFYRRRRVLEYCDITVSAFPLAWMFGRMGCSVVHDHPGMLSNAWYAVRYPVQDLAAGFAGRIDLGLTEMVLTIPLAIACHLLWRKRPLRPNGFYVGLTLTVYAPERFLLDFLRVGPNDPMVTGHVMSAGDVDPRYFHLTPAQWACVGALALGLYYLRKTRGAKYELISVAESDEADESAAEAAAERPRPKKKKKKSARRSGPAAAPPSTAPSEPGAGADP